MGAFLFSYSEYELNFLILFSEKNMIFLPISHIFSPLYALSSFMSYDLLTPFHAYFLHTPHIQHTHTQHTTQRTQHSTHTIHTPFIYIFTLLESLLLMVSTAVPTTPACNHENGVHVGRASPRVWNITKWRCPVRAGVLCCSPPLSLQGPRLDPGWAWGSTSPLWLRLGPSRAHAVVGIVLGPTWEGIWWGLEPSHCVSRDKSYGERPFFQRGTSVALWWWSQLWRGRGAWPVTQPCPQVNHSWQGPSCGLSSSSLRASKMGTAWLSHGEPWGCLRLRA